MAGRWECRRARVRGAAALRIRARRISRSAAFLAVGLGFFSVVCYPRRGLRLARCFPVRPAVLGLTGERSMPLVSRADRKGFQRAEGPLAAGGIFSSRSRAGVAVLVFWRGVGGLRFKGAVGSTGWRRAARRPGVRCVLPGAGSRASGWRSSWPWRRLRGY